MNNSNQFLHLKDKWSVKKDKITKALVETHKETLNNLNHNLLGVTVGSLGSIMVAVGSPSALPVKQNTPITTDFVKLDNNVFLMKDMQGLVPTEVRELTGDEETQLTNFLSDRFNMRVRASLDGIRLNRSYGYIGQEQHLKRYPGDTVSSHFDSNESASQYAKYGLAPGLGAYRYFTDENGQLTQEGIDREKYYIAVQTFLAPGFHDDVRRYANFFKFRKMLVINPENGKAIVVVIGDAGPAAWTGKQLGGSPEVMSYLERVDGANKGPVLYFFIDDPNDSIKLGPVTV